MAEQVLDPRVLEELLDLGDEDDAEFVVELIGLFLRDAPARVQAVIDGAGAGDFEQVEQAAHALKGSAGNLGAMVLHDLAQELQEASRGRDGECVSSRAPKIGATFADAERALHAFVAEIKSR